MLLYNFCIDLRLGQVEYSILMLPNIYFFYSYFNFNSTIFLKT
ncbi:hypothetical protein LEP1GSC074_3793 [Leptospira noguchii str. Hook]|nr:hypothetical protein LEP1GSC074_3793 [Leptospira noguchii str. Hook]